LLHTAFEVNNEQYEIWKGSLEDPAMQQLINRIEILVLLFIEGGSFISRPDSEGDSGPSDANRWTVFLLYKRIPSPSDPEHPGYVFAGYTTVYRFFHFQLPSPPSSPPADWELPKTALDLSESPCRSRLSQFIILPPFQDKGLGSKLYKVVYSFYQNHGPTKEITVEDPNEAFDDMRDLADLSYLRTVPEFTRLRIDTGIELPKKSKIPTASETPKMRAPKNLVDDQLAESVRIQAKIVPRQFYRVLELQLMSKLPNSVRPGMSTREQKTGTEAEQHEYELWQIYVKKRIYRHNRDTLTLIDRAERFEKLQLTLTSVELEYARLLAALERREQRSKKEIGNVKRRINDDSDDSSSSKRARLQDA
jgi:histone acetyltransferase 1